MSLLTRFPSYRVIYPDGDPRVACWPGVDCKPLEHFGEFHHLGFFIDPWQGVIVADRVVTGASLSYGRLSRTLRSFDFAFFCAGIYL